jgi:CubicO group peptidase (beta-lactamase class C family)
MGKSATENVFGHDGFTGTTVFADPDNDYIFVCLTNKMQCGFRTATSNNYYNTNSWASWNMNQAVKDVLGI